MTGLALSDLNPPGTLFSQMRKRLRRSVLEDAARIGIGWQRAYGASRDWEIASIWIGVRLTQAVGQPNVLSCNQTKRGRTPGRSRCATLYEIGEVTCESASPEEKPPVPFHWFYHIHGAGHLCLYLGSAVQTLAIRPASGSFPSDSASQAAFEERASGCEAESTGYSKEIFDKVQLHRPYYLLLDSFYCAQRIDKGFGPKETPYKRRLASRTRSIRYFSCSPPAHLLLVFLFRIRIDTSPGPTPGQGGAPLLAVRRIRRT